ncbi:MAG: lysophospholipid acyltransferase family protein [Microscillaceae bacterium]|jgi:1-acyl-sn-glycerol-3-phosphate acyltransferase|nr:lysophospholipid acyltransferase family protein [Microscillaceae bacterium]
MLYALLKVIAQIALRVFFKSLKIKNRELLPTQGPLIVVANHPNTFMDPLVIASYLKPQVYFLANASVFHSKFAQWLFPKLNMIPIQRKHDTNQKKYDNEQVFQKCFDHLARGGTILIFPEGTSVHKRILHEIKTGTARIALGAEQANDFRLNLKIVTFGLNYSNPASFRSEVFVNVDEPIQVADYQAAYQADSYNAVNILTEDIRKNIEEHVIAANTDEEDRLAKQIELVYKSKLNAEIQLAEESKEQDYLMTKAIIHALEHFQEHEPERVKTFKPKLEKYLSYLRRLDLNDEVFAKKSLGKNIFIESIRTAVYFVLGFPLFLYGLINNYVPYIIPSKVAAYITRLAKFPEYTAPVMMVTGVLTFTFFYILQTALCYWFIGSGWCTLAYFVSLPISGFFALLYANYLAITEDRWRVFTLFFKRTDLITTLISQRKEIIRDLEKAKNDYLAFYRKEVED